MLMVVSQRESVKNDKPTISMSLSHCIHQTLNSKASTRFHSRSEERFSRNAETDIVCRLLLEKKKKNQTLTSSQEPVHNPTEPQFLDEDQDGQKSDNDTIYYVTVSKYHLFTFFINDTATIKIYTLSLHDALPISANVRVSKTINQPSA